MLRPAVLSATALSLAVLFPCVLHATAQRKPPVIRPVITPAPATAPDSASPKPGADPVQNTVSRAARAWTLPSISYGPPQPRTSIPRAQIDALRTGGAAEKPEPRDLTAVVGGQSVTRKVLRLRGRDDIERSDLPDDAKTLLIMHMQKIPASQSDQYIVNPELAEEWFRTHPKLPPTMKPADERKSSSGKKRCSAISTQCAAEQGQGAVEAVEEEAERLADKASAEWERARKQAEESWNRASNELTEAWEMAQGCFADQTLSLKDIPVRFSIAPAMSLGFSTGERKRGSATGNVDGTLELGFPMESDFRARLELFYIPCLPFVIRPKALAADGAMRVGEKLVATLIATGEFEKTFRIPPSGGPAIPIAMLPIVVAGVPVAEIDISAYIEGSVTVTGHGKAAGSFAVENTNTVQFDFACEGSGCRSGGQNARDPLTVTESAQLEGQVSVEPAVYTALQLNFNFNALSVRAGPEPYLLASMAGCTSVSAEQTEGGGSSSSHSEALTADLDWGVKFRAEALVMGQIVGTPFIKSVTGDRHILFRDLAGGGSTGLLATVATAHSVTAGQPATYKVKMPSCYPYKTPVQYKVSWTGDAVVAPIDGCDWQKGICKFDPSQELTINLTWPAAGNFTLTVAPVGDEHGTGRSKQLRTFTPAPKATELSVTVAPAG